MIVLALDENLDPALVSDLLQEAGFKVVKGLPQAPYAVFDQSSLDGLLQRTSEAGAARKTSDTATPAMAECDREDGQTLGPLGVLRSACAWPRQAAGDFLAGHRPHC
jgi:hypothetical protein